MHYKAASPHLSRVDVRLVDRIARHIGPVDCRVVNHAMLVEAANSLYPRGSNATKNRKVVSPAAAILHYAAAQEWCDDRRFPKFAVSQKSTRVAATDETMALLLANCEAPARTRPQGRKADHQVAYKRLLLVMLYELGLRIMDTLRIERGNIDLTTGRVRVRISKTDDWASLELSPVVVSMIANLPGAGRLFPWSTTRGVYGWLKPLTDRLGVTYTPHMSRHALATAASDANIPDKKAAELGVWRDPRSLQRYQHVKPETIPGRHAGTLAAGFARGSKAK
jgi:integrase